MARWRNINKKKCPFNKGAKKTEKMYKYKKAVRSTIKGIEVIEGETIEKKIERIVHNGEPITDGSPEIFTARKDGVPAAYNIRTDRWEIAAEALNSISGSIDAKRENKGKIGASESLAAEIAGKEKNSIAESTQGNTE